MSTIARASTRGVAAALREIQGPVRDRLEQVNDELVRIIVTDLPIAEEVAEHLMGMKGKMFRPTLLLLASAVSEAPEPRALALAAVVEVIHVATLVHDDAVDHSVLRRGMPTINALFSHQVSVIMGDFLYSRAVAELTRLGDLEPLRIFSKASNDMTIGELRQLASLDALAFTEDDYELLIKAKTASLMSAACEVGALCGAIEHRVALARYGDRLGMAFQVADDLLDYTAAQEDTGKPAGLDLKEHKVTLPLIAAMREMSPAARKSVENFFATSEPSDAAVAEIIAMVAEHGGLEYARRRGDEFASQADEALGALPESPARVALADAIGYVMDRRS